MTHFFPSLGWFLRVNVESRSGTLLVVSSDQVMGTEPVT